MKGTGFWSARQAYPILAMASALLFFAVLQVLAWGKTGGYFEYPLDDVYIHLAMADGIARGEYGINAGEYASADSSILFPVLIAPFSSAAFERFVPLVLNALSLAGAAWLWGMLLARSSIFGWPGTVLAIFGPIALNLPGVAFTGMEHSTHILVSLAVLLGLCRYLEDGKIGWLLVAGVVLGPMLRFEGLGVSAAACLVLLTQNDRKAAVLLGLAALTPVALFVAFLQWHHIGPLPMSVMAKLDLAVGAGPGHEEVTILRKLMQFPGQFVFFMALFYAVFTLWMWRREHQLWPVVLAASLVGFLHLGFGKFGWSFRYEGYVVVLLVTVSLIGIVPTMQNRAMALVTSLVLVAIPGVWYVTGILSQGPISAGAIHLQQSQMARFVKDIYQKPVAVNDIGYVTWRNPYYVLDLWGLASRDALELRLDENAAQGWAAGLVKAHSVDLAMIYQLWLARAVPPDWQRLGALNLTGTSGWVAEKEVVFYATSPDVVAELREKLQVFQHGLPEGVDFDFADTSP